MRTPETILEDWEEALRRAAIDYEHTKNEIDHRYKQTWEKAREFGGFIRREEAQQYLGISRPRLSVLISTGRIREIYGHGCSLKDVQQYHRTRKTGRPRTW